MTLIYTKEIREYWINVVILVIALCGLLLIVWWRKNITYTYREAIEKQNVERLENSFEEYKLSAAENELQLAVYSKLFHYLNKVLPGCALIAEGDAKNMLQRVLHEMNLANEKCALQNIPQIGESVIDVPIIQLYTAAERKNLKVSTTISADVKNWFSDSKILKEDIHILLSYLCDNAINSALGSPNARARVELSATANHKPLICIYDSGEPFDEEVLAKLGLEQVTTRAGVGGSGIGLFTVFEILAKYNASFTLDEAPPIHGYTKSITVTFDESHSFVVRTLRESVVAACAARKEIVIQRIIGIDLQNLRDGTNG
ncbi:MAG: GHKL domain-containing protein [Clostridia bacterium]|nr:GHKL domain-containing protein [Clostridia bacterium]